MNEWILKKKRILYKTLSVCHSLSLSCGNVLTKRGFFIKLLSVCHSTSGGNILTSWNNCLLCGRLVKSVDNCVYLLISRLRLKARGKQLEKNLCYIFQRDSKNRRKKLKLKIPKIPKISKKSLKNPKNLRKPWKKILKKIPKITKIMKKSQKSQKSLEKSLENLTKFKFLSFFFRVICPLS